MVDTQAYRKKSKNLRMILKSLIMAESVSRIDLVQVTELTKQSISNLTDELENAHFIKKMGVINKGVGKPTDILSIKADGAYTIGVHVQRSHIRLGIYDLKNKQIAYKKLQIDTLVTEKLPNVLYQLCTDTIAEYNIAKDRILGVGLVLPQPHRFRSIHNNKDNSDFLDNYTIREYVVNTFQEKMNMPIVASTLSTACAVKETLYGDARNLDSYVYIYLGNSIDASFIQGDFSALGANNIAGLLGHMIVDTDGRACHCGNNGCLNQYASLESLRQHICHEHKRDITIDSIIDNLSLYKPDIHKWLGDMGEPMRIALSNIENLFNPQTIILSGQISDDFLDDFIGNLRPLLPSVVQLNDRVLPRLIRTKHDDDLEIKSAGALLLYSLFTQERKRNTMICPIARLDEIIQSHNVKKVH